MGCLISNKLIHVVMATSDPISCYLGLVICVGYKAKANCLYITIQSKDKNKLSLLRFGSGIGYHTPYVIQKFIRKFKVTEHLINSTCKSVDVSLVFPIVN